MFLTIADRARLVKKLFKDVPKTEVPENIKFQDSVMALCNQILSEEGEGPNSLTPARSLIE